MEIKEFDYDNATGFAWIIVGTNRLDGEWSIQCCLKEGEGQAYTEEIDAADCGHDWGICADVNKEAFEYWGTHRCMKALFAAAKANGIEVV